MFNLIRSIRFKRACRKIAAIHGELLTEMKRGRTDVRLSGHVYGFRVQLIADLEGQIAALAAHWNADAETMRLAGI